MNWLIFAHDGIEHHSSFEAASHSLSKWIFILAVGAVLAAGAVWLLKNSRPATSKASARRKN